MHSVELCMPPPAGPLNMLWHWPTDPQNWCVHPCPKNASMLKAWWNSVQHLSRHLFNKAKKCTFQHVGLHCDLELWPFDPKTGSVHPHPKMHQFWKFSENMCNSFHDTVLITFGMHWQTYRHKNTIIVYLLLLRATAYMLSAHMLSQFRPSVCLSVCPSHGWFMQKRL